jgi:hypothetical protein
MVKLRLKRLSVLFGLMIGLSFLMLGCKTPATPAKPPEAIRAWWGNKEKVIEFLQGPNAQADRWVVEAVGG